MGLPVRTCSAPNSLMISVPEAGLLPMVCAHQALQILRLSPAGIRFCRPGKAWSSQTRHFPMAGSVSFRRTRGALPYEPMVLLREQML